MTFSQISSVAALLLVGVDSLRNARSWHAGATKTMGGVPVFGVPSRLRSNQGKMMAFFSPKTTDVEMYEFCKEQGSCSMMGHEGRIPFVAFDSSASGTERVIATRSSSLDFLEYDGEVEFWESMSTEFASKSTPWHLDRVGVPSSSKKGEGVNIYILDSGVRCSHRDFTGRAIPTYDGTSGSGVVCNGDFNCAQDWFGHGTHVAGTAGGRSFGVAPAATIHAMALYNPISGGLGGMDYVAGNAKYPAVISMSFGTRGYSPSLEVGVNAVFAAGVTVVVASGNSNTDACDFTMSMIPAAISVGSTDSTDSRSSFSNFGNCIDIYAPGSQVLSTSVRGDDRTEYKSGTSMAAPMVSGGVALILQENPSYSPVQVLTALRAQSKKNFIRDAGGLEQGNYFLQVA